MDIMSSYRTDEIKYKIDTAIQRAMYDTVNDKDKDKLWNGADICAILFV